MESGSPQPLPDDSATLLALQLRVFGLVLLVLYVANCLGDILPPRILSPLWLIGVTSSLVNNGGIAGTGLVLLHLAHHVGTDTGRALALRESIARWAALAALGFLLLVPLQIFAVTSGLLNVRASLDQREKQIDRQADLLRSAIRNAEDVPQLQRRMLVISGPLPGPDDLKTPLPQLQKSLLKLVDLEVTRLKGNIDRNSFLRESSAMVKQTVRICISALALSLGFGVLAQQDVAFPTPLIRLLHSIRRLPKALKAKQLENQERAVEQEAVKRFRTNLERMSKHNQRLAREAQRKEEGSVIEKVEKFCNRVSGQKSYQHLASEAESKQEGSVIEKIQKFWNRVSGQNRKGPPIL
jgi:hypothetical protein